MSIETRSGLTPSEKEMPFLITSSQVTKYLQNKLNVIAAKDKSVPKMNIKIVSFDVSKKFVPFAVVLPTSALQKGRGKNDDRLDPIFNPNHASKREMLIQPLFEFFRGYVYTSRDFKDMSNQHVRHELGLSQGKLNTLKNMAIPKKMTIGQGSNRQECVFFLLDPINVFHDMLESKNPAKGGDRFNIEIDGVKKISSGEYEYNCLRCEMNTVRKTEDIATHLSRLVASSGIGR